MIAKPLQFKEKEKTYQKQKEIIIPRKVFFACFKKMTGGYL